MKKTYKILAGLGAALLASMFIWTGVAAAHSFRSGNSVIVGQSETVNQTLFAAGRNIDINSEVFGDVICAGQTVTISGTVHGDVICAGQTVNVGGTIDGDVRLVGQTVTLGAAVEGNATIGGQSFTLESTAVVNGDVTVGSSDASINGVVGRDLAVGGQQVAIAGQVGRNIKGAVQNLSLLDNARVRGNIEYRSTSELNRAESAVVDGTVTRTEPTATGKSKRGAVFGFGVAWFVYWLLAMLVTAMALALMFPRLLHNVTDNGWPWPWKPLLTGFLASLAVPVVLVVVAITVVGLPLAFILGLIWLLIMLLSGPVSAYLIGRFVLRETRNALLIMLVGASLLLVSYFIPIIGILAILLAAWAGSGMILMELFRRTPKPVYELAHENNSGRRNRRTVRRSKK